MCCVIVVSVCYIFWESLPCYTCTCLYHVIHDKDDIIDVIHVAVFIRMNRIILEPACTPHTICPYSIMFVMVHTVYNTQ